MKKVDFDNDPITKNIIQTALPMLAAQIISLLYNIVDRIYIGRIEGYGTQALGAIGLCFPIVMLINGFTNMFGLGGAPLFSIELGQNNKKKACDILNTAFRLEIITGLLLMTLCELAAPQILSIFGAAAQELSFSVPYIRIYLTGTIFIMISTGMNPYINAQGYAAVGMKSVWIGAAANIVLDPVFIFVLRWGVEGAALATILSQFIGFLCNFAYLFRFKHISLKRSSFLVEACMVGRVASLGFASCFNNLTSTVVAMVSNNLLTKYGALSEFGPDIPITTFGLCMKVSMIAFSVGIGVASGSQPILGFNYGAEKYKRVKQTFLLSVGICTLITVVAWVIFQCFPLQLIRIFGTESELYEKFAVQCFRIYLLLTFLNGLQMCAGVLFQAIGQPVKAAVASLSKQLLFYVPAMLIVSRISGLTGVLWAGPVADALAFVLCLVLCVRELRKMDGMPE